MTAPSWVPGAAGSGFEVDHLPYGVFSRNGSGNPAGRDDSAPRHGPAPRDDSAPHDGSAPRHGSGPRVGVRIGDHVLDLYGVFGDEVFAAPSLNAFMAEGRARWEEVRTALIDRLTSPAQRGALSAHLHPLSAVTLQLPFEVADYVDFYCSLEHATNLGRMFRPDAEALLPNWRHLPVGYHGRSGTVVVSGTSVKRPSGQRRSEAGPVFGPSVRLDIEAEMGFVVGVPTALGTRPGAFEDHVFGVVLVNDWSARDIQAWEYVPLGPFLGKSFATSVAAWVTPLAALEHARVAGRPQDPSPLPYLSRQSEWGLDIAVSIDLNGQEISRPPYRELYWTPDQMLAHMTVNGASLRTGDLFASGTISGAEPGQRGSLIEITWNGTEPLKLPDGSTRTFLNDGDTVTLRATAGPITLGEVTGTITP